MNNDYQNWVDECERWHSFYQNDQNETRTLETFYFSLLHGISRYAEGWDDECFRNKVLVMLIVVYGMRCDAVPIWARLNLWEINILWLLFNSLYMIQGVHLNCLHFVCLFAYLSTQLTKHIQYWKNWGVSEN